MNEYAPEESVPGAAHDAVDAARFGDGTRAVRAGLPDPVKNEPPLPGPVFAAHFHLPGEVEGPYTYGRDTNPTWTLLERAIGELEAPGEDVHTVVFASGMAAVSAVALSQAHTGDTVVLPDDGYQALPLLREQLEAYGIHVRTAPTGDDAQLAVLDGARLLWIETPSNPGLDVCDVRRLADAAHAAWNPGRRRQHPRHPARAAAAGARGGLLRGERHQGPHRPRRPAARVRRVPRPGARRPCPEVAQDRRRHPGPHGGLARPPLPGHDPVARAAPVGQRAGRGRGPGSTAPT